MSQSFDKRCRNADDADADNDGDVPYAKDTKHILNMSQGYDEIFENTAVKVLMKMMILVQVRALPEEKLEDFFHLSIARF